MSQLNNYIREQSYLAHRSILWSKSHTILKMTLRKNGNDYEIVATKTSSNTLCPAVVGSTYTLYRSDFFTLNDGEFRTLVQAVFDCLKNDEIPPSPHY